MLSKRMPQLVIGLVVGLVVLAIGIGFGRYLEQQTDVQSATTEVAAPSTTPPIPPTAVSTPPPTSAPTSPQTVEPTAVSTPPPTSAPTSPQISTNTPSQLEAETPAPPSPEPTAPGVATTPSNSVSFCPGGAVSNDPQVMPFFVFQDQNAQVNHFCPAGYMGDVGDITMTFGNTILVTYKFEGKGPNNCNSSPCKWAGVYWMNPDPSGTPWASKPGHGYNLSQATRLKFRARSDQGAVVEFKVGGIEGPYPDSLQPPPPTTRPVQLTTDWNDFEIPLQGNRSYVIGGFLWVTNWDSNPGKDQITFEVDDVRYEK